MPEVSVVMPTFNSSAYVCQAVDSVIGQSFTDWELLIVDDASVDGTPELVRQRYAHEPRVKLTVLQANSGAAVARNTAIAVARGRFIAFLDSDDLWHKDKLQLQLPVFEETGACMVFSAYQVVRNTDPRVVRSIPAPPLVRYGDFLTGDPVGCLTAIYDTQKTGRIFMPEIRMRQDWGLWLRLLRDGGFAVGMQQPLATLRLHGKSLSANKFRAMYFNYMLLRSEAGLPAMHAFTGALRHAFRALSRRLRKA
jgi:hypothetical protein